MHSLLHGYNRQCSVKFLILLLRKCLLEPPRPAHLWVFKPGEYIAQLSMAYYYYSLQITPFFTKGENRKSRIWEYNYT